MTTHRKTQLKSPAKVNLTLTVLGKLPNGYHALRSLVCLIDLYDEIEIEKSDQLKISFTGIDSHSIPPLNTVQKVINILNQKIKQLDPEAALITDRITINKKIPTQSGLGGGSSNAATLIKYYGDKYNVPLKDQFNIASQIGADVSLFLKEKPHIMGGAGEDTLDFVDLPEFYMVVVTPQQGNSTRKIFETLDLSNCNQTQMPLFDTSLDTFITFLKHHKNDLTKPAKQINTDVTKLLKELEQCPNVLYSDMTGSGSSCFAIFKTAKEAKRAQKYLSKNKKYRLNQVVKPL